MKFKAGKTAVHHQNQEYISSRSELLAMQKFLKKKETFIVKQNKKQKPCRRCLEIEKLKGKKNLNVIVL